MKKVHLGWLVLEVYIPLPKSECTGGWPVSWGLVDPSFHDNLAKTWLYYARSTCSTSSIAALQTFLDNLTNTIILWARRSAWSRSYTIHSSSTAALYRHFGRRTGIIMLIANQSLKIGQNIADKIILCIFGRFFRFQVNILEAWNIFDRFVVYGELLR